MPQKSNTSEIKSPDIDEVCLRWNSHHHNMKSMFPILLQREQFVDVTLTSEGKIIKCHKLILSSCSTYFDNILCDVPPNQHVIIFLNSVPFWLLKILVDFMYTGEVHINQNKLQDLLAVAEILQIKGLTGKAKDDEKTTNKNQLENNEKTMINSINEIEKNTTKSVQEKEAIPQVLKQKSIGKIEDLEKNKKVKVKMQNSENSMPLLKPIYTENNPDVKVKDSPKKTSVKKVKKRKSSEHEVSPPPILYRKGTKSRPHVKVPKYYHNDYEDLDAINMLNFLQNKEMNDKEKKVQCDLNRVKTEPEEIDNTETLFTEISEEEVLDKNKED